MSSQTQTTPERAHDLAVLSALLHDQLAVLQKLKDLAHAQRSVLADRKPDEIWDNLSETEACWQTLHSLETKRVAAAARLARDLGLHSDDTGLGVLASALSGKAAERLTQLHAALLDTTQDLVRLNAQNGELVQGLLLLTGHQLKFYTALGQGFQSYNASGQKTGVPAPIVRSRRSA